MSSNEVSDVIQRVRDTYVRYFHETAEKLSLGTPFQSATEVKFSNLHDFFGNSIAVDFVANAPDGPEAQFINSDTFIRFSPSISGQVGSLSVVIEPFTWDNVCVEFETADLDQDAFEEWFESWFDDARQPDNSNPGAIHSVELRTDALIIDLGTSPVDAFWHLLSVLDQSGITLVTVRTNEVALPLN